MPVSGQEAHDRTTYVSRMYGHERFNSNAGDSLARARAGTDEKKSKNQLDYL